ncbi:MAG: NUDIX hydrolase [Clostridia bacterium]|jgi:8-oxo-dGTP pyrophosphatase MutT (NUDIX family)|nr:NUDIX hydrolase [Clostridia bacterium]
MIHKIENKKVRVMLKDEMIELPEELKEKIKENFKNILKTGVNVWDGEVLCVSDCNIGEEVVEIICKKSNYSHYLYGERIGCSKEYECKNLSAGCLIETVDGYYLIGELDDTTSYPGMLQTTGGGVDKKDIKNGNIDIEQTIKREALEELNIDLEDKSIVLDNSLYYIYISEENEQPGVQVFSKAKITMTASEMREHFEKYYKYLKENNLELEFKKLYFLKVESAVEELNKLENNRRNYLLPLVSVKNI